MVSYILMGMIWFSYYLISVYSTRKNGTQLFGNNIVITIDASAILWSEVVYIRLSRDSAVIQYHISLNWNQKGHRKSMKCINARLDRVCLRCCSYFYQISGGKLWTLSTVKPPHWKRKIQLWQKAKCDDTTIYIFFSIMVTGCVGVYCLLSVCQP